TRFFQAGLTASPLRFATVVVTTSGYLLSGNKFWPMPGTRVSICNRRCGLKAAQFRSAHADCVDDDIDAPIDTRSPYDSLCRHSL
ncbi:MAG: hypothetical protein LAT65_07770, partial [Saccharospirillum sp.]|nr:hypothetical protein [Saccharospirillum sp.]